MIGIRENNDEAPSSPWGKLALIALAGTALAYLKTRGLRRNKRTSDALSDTLAPGPEGVPLLGNLPRLNNSRLETFWKLRDNFGDVVRLRLGTRVIHLVSHPDYAQHILQNNNRNYVKGRGLEKAQTLLGNGLLTSEGEFWLRQRRLMQPAFHRQKISRFATIMAEATNAMLARWKSMADTEESFDVAQEMVHLTLDIVSKTLFSSALTPQQFETVATTMKPLLEFAARRITSPFDFVESWPIPANRQQQERQARLDEIIYRIIEERRRSQEEREDLLGMLVAAQDEETGELMNDRQLRDELMTIFLAGHETTANLLAFTWALLSEHVAVRQKVQEEVDTVLQGRRPTAADVSKLPYTRMVLDEVLRLYPPAWVIGRKALEADQIGGFHIPADSGVLISPYLIHRHPDFWENPEGFDPLRFTPERSQRRPRYAYLPFGGGPRLCIGNNFALMEATIIVAIVSQQYELNLVPGRPLSAQTAFTMRAENGVHVQARRRG